MAVIVKDYLPGQEVALQENIITVCLDQATDSNVLLRLWVVICLARLWQRYDKARWRGVRDSAHEKLYALLNDKEAEVRRETMLRRRAAAGVSITFDGVIRRYEPPPCTRWERS